MKAIDVLSVSSLCGALGFALMSRICYEQPSRGMTSVAFGCGVFLATMNIMATFKNPQPESEASDDK